MKKIAIILLTLIYAASTFAIGVKQFYCCGKLKSTDIAFVQQEAKEKDGKADAKTGCCKTEFKSLKVKDTHVTSETINIPAKHFTHLQLFSPSFEVRIQESEQFFIANASHAPPLHQGVPVYILYCVYRI